MTVNSKLQFSPVPANFCCGWVESPICQFWWGWPYGEISWAATFFCWKWQNWDFAIAITFYPVIRTLWNFLCILFGSCSTQILNFNAKKFFLDMLKIVRKSGFDPIVAYFRTIIYISKKKFFALKFKIWVLQLPNNMHKKFHKDLFTG